VQLVGDAIRKILGSSAAEQLVGMAAWTDTALLAEAGIPGIVFGPSGRGPHGKEEYVELDSVIQCGEILLEAIRSACSQ
jgi:acetylornithine deacetylase/succinyl-diaminopimelate desuccinylase-like protein